MSTVAEHLATLEMYAANGEWELFNNEQYLFVQVHWKEMIGERPSKEMDDARASIEARFREQHGDKVEAYIDKWRIDRAGAKGGSDD